MRARMGGRYGQRKRLRAKGGLPRPAPLCCLSRPRRGRAARPPRPRARRGRPPHCRPRPRRGYPPRPRAALAGIPALPFVARPRGLRSRPPCGETRDFWPRNRALARRTRPFARRGRSSPAKAQVGGFGKADAPSDRGRSVPELGLAARNRERANMKGGTCGVWKRQTCGQKPRAREHEGALGCGMLEAIARGRRRCGRGGCDVPCGDAAALRERGCDTPCGDATAGRDTPRCTARATRAKTQPYGCERAGQRKRYWSESAGTQPCECSGGWGRGQCDRADRALLHARSKFLLAENCMEGGPACP